MAKRKKEKDARDALKRVRFRYRHLAPNKCPDVPFFSHAHRASTPSSNRTQIAAGLLQSITPSSKRRDNCQKAKIARVTERLHVRPQFAIESSYLDGRRIAFDARPLGMQDTLLPGTEQGVDETIPVQKLFLFEGIGGARCYTGDNEAANIFTLVDRGTALSQGLEHPSELYSVLDKMTSKSKHVPRGKGKTLCFPDKKAKYSCPGVFPLRGGPGIGFRQTAGSVSVEEQNLLEVFFSRTEKIMYQYIPSKYVRGIHLAKNMLQVPNFCSGNKDQLFGSAAFGKRVFLTSHRDDDTFFSVVTVIGKHDPTLNGDILCYFTFAEYGLAVALRSGDVLVFNPRVHHCVTSPVSDTSDYFCFSFYMKTSVVGGNDNSKPINCVERQLIDFINNS